jgi:hypothetical protein
VLVAVPLLNKNGLTVATGLRCAKPEEVGTAIIHKIKETFSRQQFFHLNIRMTLSSPPCIVSVVLLLPSDSLSGSCKTKEIFLSPSPAML